MDVTTAPDMRLPNILAVYLVQCGGCGRYVWRNNGAVPDPPEEAVAVGAVPQYTATLTSDGWERSCSPGCAATLRIKARMR